MFVIKTLFLVLLVSCFVYGEPDGVPSTADNASSAADGRLDPDTRVVGGKDAPEGFAPYQVSIRTKNNFHFCGGAVISNRWILTATHCVLKLQAKDIVAVVGTNSRTKVGKKYEISKIITHPQYNKTVKFSNDIAIISTTEEIVFSDKVKQIKLASRDTPGGTKCLLTGWGYTEKGKNPAENLQYLYVKALSVDGCKKYFSRYRNATPVSDYQICTLNKKGEGTCQGDSGGALVENNEAVGVVSFNYPCALGHPDVYARVYKFVNWIKANMKDP